MRKALKALVKALNRAKEGKASHEVQAGLSSV